MTEPLARKLAMGILGRIHVGQLTVIEGDRETVFGSGAPQATVHVHSPKALAAVRCAAAAAWARSYMDGLWDTPDLTAVIRVAARNVGRIDDVRRRLSPIREPFQRARAAFMRNTPQRSRKDIAAHYDLGNELFALMLDPTLMYSCGVFEHRDATLEEASLAKLEMVCEKLELGPRDHVVEIGTGWGGFAVYAATTRGCKVTTTTISKEQHDVAARRVKEAGVEHLVDLRLDDYRDLARHLRQARLAGDDRGGRLAGLRHVLRALLASCSPRTGRCCCRRSRWTTARIRSRRRRRASSAPTSSPAAACPRSR